MNVHIFCRSSALVGGALLAGSMLLVPATANAAPFTAENETAAACAVTDGTLTWGVKESFRSYISGSIANGSWETADGATYETPEFQWSGGTGSVDPATGTGSVSFTGTIHFTGHDGVLDMTLANPTIEFDGDGIASLMLDAKSNDANGELVVDAEQEWVGDMTVSDELAPTEGVLELSDIPTLLTNSGAKAFAGFYEADVELDPISVTLPMADCEVGEVAPATSEPSDESAAEVAPATETAESSVPWVPIAIGGAAILVIGVTAGMLISGRKRPNQTSPANQTPGSAETTTSESQE